MQPPSSVWRERLASLVVLLFLLGWLLHWAPSGLESPFSPDDMMNLYGAWDLDWNRLLPASLAPWTKIYRPVGSVAYLGLFEIFGWNPYPFRLFCYGLLAANAWLVFRLTWELSGNTVAGFAAGLAAAYHTRLVGLYADTGRIYDVLGATLSLLCLLVYFQPRTRLRAGLALVLFVLAVETKESAAALPAAVLIFDAAARRRPSWLAWSLAAVAAVAMWAKTSPGSALHQHPAYTPELTWARAVANLSGYGSQLLYRPSHSIPVLGVVAGLVVLSLLVLIPRSAVRLGAAWAVMGLGPLLFIDERDFGAVYLSFLGLAVLAGGLLAACFERIPIRGHWFQIAVMVWLSFVLAKQHRIDRLRTPAPSDWARSWPDVASFRRELLGLAPAMAPDAVVRFRSHRFQEDWMPLFILKLTYGRRTIHVSIDRVTGTDRAPPDVDYLLEERDGGLRLVQ